VSYNARWSHWYGKKGFSALSCKSNPLVADNRTKSALVISLAGTLSSRKTHFTVYEGSYKPKNVSVWHVVSALL